MTTAVSESKTLQLYDTLSGSVRPLTPADGSTFRFYCCGPTVYGPAHIGNFRTFLVQDVLRRVIRLTGIPHLHVRNITDVDDKTIRESIAESVSLTDFTSRWRDRFHADCEQLNMLKPHEEPAAVAHMEDIINLIQTLMDKGLAYQAGDGSVYYKIQAFPRYGALSKLSEREIRPGQRAVSQDEYDDDTAADFALWKAAKDEDGPNRWDSPWGPGRPGWHIECSAMSLKYLGREFDLHAGGVDLIFPHHENEIAQSEGATGCCFARHWFHSAHLMVDGGKMSKSLGNLYTLDDIRQQGFDPVDLRYALIAGHSRKPLNYTTESLHAARQANRRLAEAVQEWTPRAPGGIRPPLQTLIDTRKTPETLGRFFPAWESLLNQLNTPKALGNLFSALGRSGKSPASSNPASAEADAVGFFIVLDALGLEPVPVDTGDIPDDIEEIATKRQSARAEKDWPTSDALRDELLTRGWAVKDTRDGYELERL